MIRFEHTSKIYPNNTLAVNDVSFSINQGEFVTLIGPSGCGKTTVLKMINGLIPHTEGEIFVNNKKISDWDPIRLRRNIGYVIQQVGLFPHMKIKDNINYVLKIKGEKSSHEKALELCQLVGLEENYLNRYPRELSGGQQQRVGVARALAANPEIILMDEPFGAIDRITRTQLQRELKDLQKRLQKTIIFVTHDIEEALTLGQRVMVMNSGRIEQFSTPLDLLIGSGSQFVQEFLGEENFYHLLSIIQVKDVLESIEEKYSPSNMEGTISADASLSQALQLMFTQGRESLLIEEKGIVIGRFTFTQAYQKLRS